MKQFPMTYYFILTMLLINGLIAAGRMLYRPPVDDIAVIMYEYTPDTEVIVNGKVFKITDYN